MTSLTAEPGEAVAVVARMLELNGFAGAGGIRCPRNPKEAALVDALGDVAADAWVHRATGCRLTMGRVSLVNVRVDF